MLESQIEQYLYRECKKRKWQCWKFTSPNNPSVPDRIILVPGAILFVELKAPGKTPTPKQAAKHTLMRALGARVDVIDSKEGVDALVTSLEKKHGLG